MKACMCVREGERARERSVDLVEMEIECSGHGELVLLL